VTSPATATPVTVPTRSGRGRRLRTVGLVLVTLVIVTAELIGIHESAIGQQARTIRIWLTGYSFQDNTPPGSSVISHPLLHRVAAGTGTYADPITVAVSGDKNHMSDPPGTRFYLPTVRRYVIVEDSGASLSPPGDDTHLDMWIGGEGGTKEATDDCEERITGWRVPAEINPPPNRPVTAGAIFANRACNAPQLPDANQ
jgi:hypothetical protein